MPLSITTVWLDMSGETPMISATSTRSSSSAVEFSNSRRRTFSAASAARRWVLARSTSASARSTRFSSIRVSRETTTSRAQPNSRPGSVVTQ